MTDPFARLGVAMVRWRWVVLAAWVVLLGVAGWLLAPKAGSVLKAGGFFVPGSEATKAADLLEREFSAATRSNVVVVYRSQGQTVDDAAFRNEVTAATERLLAVDRVRSIRTLYNSGDPSLVSQDRHTTTASIALEGDEGELQEVVPALRERLEGLSIEHYVTGRAAINYDSQVASERDLRRAEVFTIPIVLVLLLLVFRTVVAAAIPLILGACSVVTALAMIYLIALVVDTSIFALNMGSMIGLGLGTDFSLIVISRFREERAAGRTPGDAVAVTMATAGRSITYSGVTVLLAMLLLTLLQSRLMIIRSISLAVMLVACTALLAGLTLLPALLGILGDRLEWLRVMPRPKAPKPGQAGRWYRLSHAIMRRPWAWLAASLGLLALLAFPLKDLRLYGSHPGALPPAAESVRGLAVIDDVFGAHRLTPVQIVVRTEQGGVWRPEFLDALKRLSDTVAADPRNQQVYSLATLAREAGLPDEQFRTLTPERIRAIPGGAQFALRVVNLNGDNNTAIVTVISKSGQYDRDHQAFIHDLHDTIIPEIRQLRAYDVYVGGDTSNFLDYRDALYNRFPLVVGAVMLLIFVILMMFFQSIFLPLKAIFLNLASIVATYGALVLIFQHGRSTDLLGFASLDSLNVNIVPVLFTVLFGLSTDYEVFLLSRVKEYYRETGDNEEAVATGLEHTAGVITAAGLILIGTFGSFASATNVPVKEFGVGLAVGILIDATIVRIIMVPATMRLAGKANWWIPTWLKKIVPELREGPVPALVPAPVIAGVPAGAPATVPPPVSPDGWRATPATPRAGTIGELLPTGGSVGVARIVLPRTRPFRIGRDSQAEMRLFSQRISRHHARIDYHAQHDRFVITDLHSTNGVYVNDRRITAPTALRDGDQVEIGTTGHATFSFESRATSQPSAMVASWSTAD